MRTGTSVMVERRLVERAEGGERNARSPAGRCHAARRIRWARHGYAARLS